MFAMSSACSLAHRMPRTDPKRLLNGVRSTSFTQYVLPTHLFDKGGQEFGEWRASIDIPQTDTHGWLEGHLKEQNYGADWGDFVTFSRRMKQTAGNMGVDLLLVDTGDLHDGNGLSDATTVDGTKSMPIFNEIDYDLLTIGKCFTIFPLEEPCILTVANFSH